MKTDPNAPAFVDGDNQHMPKGLTKREEFAKCFMTALIANTPNDPNELKLWLETSLKEYGNIPVKEAYAKEAVILTDALIKELNND